MKGLPGRPIRTIDAEPTFSEGPTADAEAASADGITFVERAPRVIAPDPEPDEQPTPQFAPSSPIRTSGI